MQRPGALAGLRVLDLTDESGRFAGKLLAEAGADIVRLRAGLAGAPMSGPAGGRGGVLEWWFDGGTRRVPLDLDIAADLDAFKTLASRADLLIETEPPGRLAALGIDYADLSALNPALVQVSLTSFGREGPRSGWQVSDLVANALGGVLSITGDPDKPLNGWGRQSFNFGGWYAAIAGLAAVQVARHTGTGQHVDLSLHEAVVSCTEPVLMGWFYRDVLPGVQRQEPHGIYRRQRSLHWTNFYEVRRCLDGDVMITFTPGAQRAAEWLLETEYAGAAADLISRGLQSPERLVELRELLFKFAATQPAHDLFLEGQRRHMAFGEVLTVAGVAGNPQLRARRFFRPVRWDGPRVRIPGLLFKTLDARVPVAAPPPGGPTSVGVVADRWGVSRELSVPAPPIADDSRLTPHSQPVAGIGHGGSPEVRDGAPLTGIRILDFTHVLAGPFATRILSDLGADVIKILTEVRTVGTANATESPYYAMWNRGKRAVALNMKHPRAPETFRRLVEQADFVFSNFSAGVLDRWGIGYEAAHTWNPRVTYVEMTGVGRAGPWRNFVTYAPTAQALSGITHLTGLPGQDDLGYGFSFADHVAGLAGALAALEALEARRRTGRGRHIDLAQLDVSAYVLGPAFVDYLNNGREAQPAGNRDAFEDFVPNEVYRCRADEWLAITARNDHEWQALCRVVPDATLTEDGRFATLEGRRACRALVDERLAAWAATQDADTAMRRLQAAGVPAGMVQNARDLVERDEQLAARRWFTEVEHPTHGRRMAESFPARFSATPLSPAPSIAGYGRDTFAVYGELLDLSDEEIALSIADGLFT